PPDFLAVLLFAVLRVVDDEIGSLQEIDVPFVAGMEDFPFETSVRAAKVADVRLVIGGVDDRHASRLNPVTESDRRVIEILSRHLRFSNGESVLSQLFEFDVRL